MFTIRDNQLLAANGSDFDVDVNEPRTVYDVAIMYVCCVCNAFNNNPCFVTAF